MTVYKWSGSDKYADYGGCTESDNRKRLWHDSLIGDPLPPLTAWKAPRLTQYLGEGKKKRKPKPTGDAPASGLSNLISQRAADALADIWERHALLYPVLLDDAPDPYYMVVVQTVLAADALDRAASRGAPQKYGPHPEYFAPLEEWVFNEAKLGDAVLFRLPDSNTALYVTETFKQRVVEGKLKGFCLKRRFWDDKPFFS